MTLTGADIQHLQRMTQALLECAHLTDTDLSARHALIGELLLDNAVRLCLDEDIAHLCGFARSAACEAMSAAVREKHFPHSCWSPSPWRSTPPFFAKVDGRNSASSEVRPVDRQKAAMVDTFAAVLANDPAYAAGAQALISHAERRGLWTHEDAVDE
jgi:hypothetical protein